MHRYSARGLRCLFISLVVRIAFSGQVSDGELSNGCSDGPSHCKANHAAARSRAFSDLACFLFDSQRGMSLTAPAARGAVSSGTLVEFARDVGRLKVLEIVYPSLGTRDRLFNQPRPSLARWSVISPRQL